MSREIDSNPHRSQRIEMEKLGFQSEPTDDSAVANWSGHGLRLALPHGMQVTAAVALTAIINAARVDGRNAQRRLVRELIRQLTHDEP